MERIDISELITKERIHFRQDIVQVERVELRGTTKQYCLKKIFTDDINDASKKLLEIVAMAKLSHENIVSIRSCRLSGENNTLNSIIIIMDYYPDGDLEKLIISRIKSQIKWSEKELYDYLLKLVNALEFMQSLNICHRDIKPQNILIHKSGEETNLLLSDFGASRYYEDDESTIVGTTSYLSPKVRYAYSFSAIEGKFKVDHNPFKSDVYSLGLVFIYMASFIKPTDFANLKTLPLVTDTRIKELEQLYPTLSIILRSMLEIEENKRPDFNKLKIDLENYKFCQICLKIKNLDNLFRFNQENEFLCIDCLKNVQVFIHKKL